MDYSKSRRDFVNFLRNELIGPGPFGKGVSDGEDHLVGVNPIDRFPCGVIYPAADGEVAETDKVPLEGIETVGNSENENNEDEENTFVRRYTPPSSFGMSFYIRRAVKDKNIKFSVNCHAVRYDIDSNFKENHKLQKFERIEMDDARQTIHEPQSSYTEAVKIWDERAKIHIVWRQQSDDGYIVTVSLINLQHMAKTYGTGKDYAEDRAEKSLFEARLEVNIDSGVLMDYPEATQTFIDEEQQEVQLQYSDRKIYAVGHGTSVDWKTDNNSSNEVTYLRTDSMPEVEVPMLVTKENKSQVLDTGYLSTTDDRAKIIEKLHSFINDYQEWRNQLDTKIGKISNNDKVIAKRITDKIDEVIARMTAGVDLLEQDDVVFKSFQIANEAILLQNSGKDFFWRPFQLGFILTILESVAKENSDFRDVVDLIWFPTGGGKTEAYLGVVAFLIALRKLQYPNSAVGTILIMRYTLRLLTRDQFLRATKMIFALELIRREKGELGDKPISIGMWVGGATSPNTFYQMSEKLNESRRSGVEPSLVIDKCPWCGSEFSVRNDNYVNSEHDFKFYCHNSKCAYGQVAEPLPCNIVDEALYKDPPTFLVGTVDKFARLAWEERASAFFGKDKSVRPPELIIQDELHLISGALGSIVGVYEAGIDTVLKYKKIAPKYIASTATIRSAKDQVKSLFGREMRVFPAQGISADDSYFAKTVDTDERPGRLYVGYYAPLLGRQQCFSPLGATLLATPPILFSHDEYEDRLMDAYWTNVVYHGSLKGVGVSQLAYDTDIRDYLRRLINEVYTKNEDELEPDELKVKDLLEKRVHAEVDQLTSQKQPHELSKTFGQLAIQYPQNEYLDAVLSTNMISVGLDVSRLALMVVNGQPLTTAEYIQASSRVGRSDVPGLIVTNYYRDIARNISHYEYFRSYHEAFYKFVEPTSVTPWTYQARSRALHAAYIIAVRHCFPTVDAAEFSGTRDDIYKLTGEFKKRCRNAAGDLADATDEHIDQIIDRWEQEINYCEMYRRNLVYSSDDENNDANRLIYNFDDRIHGIWPTLQSMRNVENTGLLKEIA